MKKTSITFLYLLLIFSLYSQNFLIEPTTLIDTYYDYFPTNRNGIPIQVQPEISQPHGYTADGLYIVYHAKETTISTIRTYYNYIDASDNISSPAFIQSYSMYPVIDIDPVTADPFIACNYIYDDVFTDVRATYDLFHMLGAPGLFREAFTVIDNPIIIMNPDDEFIFPDLHIGPSPIGEDFRRVYIFGRNYADNSPSGNPSANVYFGYADFITADLDAQSSLDWTFQSIPLMDQWHNEEPWVRPFYSICISDDGKIAVFGYNTDYEIFVCLNENYGEGEFNYYLEDFRKFVINPQNQDGSYVFADQSGNPHDIYFFLKYCDNMNSIFIDDNSKICFVGTMGLIIESNEEEYREDLEYLIFPKAFYFDLNNAEFSFYDLYPRGADPGDDNPMLPWDLDEDGFVDNFDAEGNVLMIQDWPIYNYDGFYAFADNNFKIVSDGDNIVTAIWQDGLRAKYAYEGIEGYEEWLCVPEIVISTSTDGGNSWQNPIFLNSIETPELENMVPAYVIPGDKIQTVNENYSELHLFFLDEYDYGHDLLQLNPGGTLKYAKFAIDLIPLFVYVICPNGGEVWQINSTYNIEWAIYCCTRSVDIDLYKNDLFYLTIADNVTNPYEIYEWTIPDSILEDDDYKIKVSYSDNPNYNDFSNDYFTISSTNIDNNEIEKIEILNLQNSPNPFSPPTTISFNLTAKNAKDAKIIIYNIKGQKVRVLECSNRVTAKATKSLYSIEWNGKDESGKPVNSGIYFYRLKSDNFESPVRKMILLR